MSLQDPKLNQSEVHIGITSNIRNDSGVRSNKTAASSNFIYRSKRPSGDVNRFKNNYSTAIVGGGGLNIYDRLLNDSTDNLLRPTATMIGGINRITS